MEDCKDARLGPLSTAPTIPTEDGKPNFNTSLHQKIHSTLCAMSDDFGKKVLYYTTPYSNPVVFCAAYIYASSIYESCVIHPSALPLGLSLSGFCFSLYYIHHCKQQQSYYNQAALCYRTLQDERGSTTHFSPFNIETNHLKEVIAQAAYGIETPYQLSPEYHTTIPANMPTSVLCPSRYRSAKQLATALFTATDSAVHTQHQR